MDVAALAKIASVMILGCIIQGSAGFGFGLFALPILLFLDFPLPEAVMIVIVGSAMQKISAVAYLRRSVDWKEILPYMLLGLAALPLGVYLMVQVSFLDQAAIKQIIGSCIVILLLLQRQGVISARETVHRFWGYLAGFFSGLLNGLANIGGPPLVLWILAHRWTNEKMRVTALAFSLVFVPFQILLLMLAFGSPILQPLVKTFLVTPVILLGSWVGLKIGAKISREHLRIYMQSLLFLIALAAVIGPTF